MSRYSNLFSIHHVSFCILNNNFSHINRDVVLTHVKGHYQEAGIMLLEDQHHSSISPALIKAPSADANIIDASKFPLNSNMYLNGLLSKMNLPLPTMNQHQQQVAAANFSAAAAVAAFVGNNLHGSQLSPIKLTMSPQLSAVGAAAASACDMTTPMVSATTSTTPAPMRSTTTTTVAAEAALLPISATPSEHGEMDEASSVGTSVTGWRDPAPYRCGHCHQVSNWKHVIQV